MNDQQMLEIIKEAYHKLYQLEEELLQQTHTYVVNQPPSDLLDEFIAQSNDVLNNDLSSVRWKLLRLQDKLKGDNTHV